MTTTMTQEGHDVLQAENSKLQRRIAELEQAHARCCAENEALAQQVQELTNHCTESCNAHATLEQQLRTALEQHEQQSAMLHHVEVLLHGIIENTPAAIFVKDREGRFLLVNDRVAEMLHSTTEQMLGQKDSDLFAADVVERWRANDRQVLETGEPVQAEVILHYDQGLRTYITTRFPIYDTDGTLYAIGGISKDITEREQTDTARALMHLRMNDIQQETLRSLATPLIPIAEKIIAMPLIGTIDTVRAQQVMETLLEGVAQHRADIAILDITGVKMIDAQVAQSLIHTAQAVRLLGARVILTGIQPHTAQTLVHLGTDLSSITTLATLQNGIAHALRAQFIT